MNPDLHPRRRIFLALSFLVLFVIVSTAGFYVLGYPDRTLLHALYLSTNILTTVGNWSDELDAGEQMWAVVMMFASLSGVTFAVTSLMAMVTSGEIQRMLGRRQLTSRIQTLRDHYIVCGFGRMGRAVCQSLTASGIALVLFDRDPVRLQAADQAGYLSLAGDASDEGVLCTAGVDRASGLITCLPHDADNVYVTLTARGMHPTLTIIARAEIDSAEARLRRAGATKVVSPAHMGAVKITSMVLHPALDDLVDGITEAGLAIDRIDLTRLPALVGRSLSALEFRSRLGITVLAVEHEGSPRVYNPTASHTLAAGDRLIVVGPRQSMDRLLVEHGTRPTAPGA